MSHAAMDFRSPITPSGVSPAIPVSQTNLGHPPATGSLNLASSTNGGFNCSNVSEKVTRSSRPKPRLVKIRKQSKMSESIGDGLGFDSFKLDPESLCRADRPAAASTHNVNGSFVFRGGSDDSGSVMNQGSKERSENVKQMGGNTFGNFHFVFSGNKSDSSSVNVEPAFGANQSKPISVSSAGIGGTVPEATRSSSFSNLKFENLANLHSNLEQKVSNNGERHSGTFEFGKFGGVASVFTANGSALQPNNLVSNEHSKSINPNNSFGANMSTSGLDFSFSNGEFGSNQKCSLKNLSSGKKESSVGGGTSVPEMNETAAFAFGSDYSFSTKNDFTGFVFGANLNNSSSFANTKAKEPFGKFQGGKADSEVESQKGSSSKVFVFRGNSEIGNLKCEESGKFDEDKHNSMNSKNAHIQDNHKFVFSSQGALDTDFHKSNVSKLSDEFNSMSFGADNNLCGKRHDNIQNVFVFGSNQTTFGFSTECGSAGMNFNNQHKNMNSRVPGNDDAVGKVEKTNVTGTGKSCTSGIDGKRASSLGVSTQNVAELLDKNTEFVNCSEQINSWRSSAGIYGKENKPINLNDKISDGSQFCFQRDNGVDRNAFSIPSFSPEGTGIQLDGSSAVSPSVSKDEKNDEASFTSLPFGIGNIFTEFKASSSSEAFSFNVDLFSGSSKKIVYESSKSVRDKMSKKKKTLRQRNLMKKQVEPQNNESPDCASPMDFSPYQDTNSAPFAETSVAKKKCPGPSDNNLDVDSGNHLGDQKNDAFSTVPSSVDGLSRIRRQYRKKYKTKVCNRSNQINQQKPVSASPAFQFPPLGNNHSSEVQRGATSSAQENGVHLFNTDEGNAKQEIPEYEACERWRIRGNQVYKGGDLYKAEDFYGKGIKSVSQSNIPECCIKPLLLCYSNRAATRMSLCRMREAINDCANAAALDPTFLKVKLRAGNCYLLLGEVQEAVQYYNSCLESRDVCLDRRITIEAAEGLQKAEKVAENLRQSAELLQQKTFDAARSALEIIAKALSISCYSEKLLEMKGEGLCKLRMYDEAIKLCEQTLDFAEKNFAYHNMENMNNSVKLWRWRIMSKSYYHLGKLEAALHLIEKQEQVFVKDGCGNSSQESSIPLGTTIRELLTRKKAGNEAFQSGKFAEALDHYNTAISCSVESLPFAAICFCNRAAAHQSLGQIIDAIADCSVAMALDENYTKAASRRATLHEMIRDYEHAVTDLQRLISLLENQEQEMDHQAGSQDRSNGSNLKELRKARQRLSSVEEKAKSEIPLDLYLILGIKASDPESDIKKAYKKAALKHHPDKAAQFLARSESMDDGQLWKDTCEKVQKDADRLFKMIGEAYAVLSDSDKRSKYNYEEEIRAARKQNKCNYTRDRSSDSNNSPSQRWSEFYSPQFRRSSSRRYGQESWRTHGNSHSDW
ncbi:uncharacterized protein LOC116019679 [Ipomoea triloba]|uniref:uncharacterized protein LOC116019679 n=1 Tax=Ipomoea triloba TaxID=35885 RepID=UPI00125DEB42|nr:uncharacterized protein LOC116019679 [Ipomoea triloba]